MLLPEFFFGAPRNLEFVFLLEDGHTLADASEGGLQSDKHWGLGPLFRVRSDFDEGRASDALRRFKKITSGTIDSKLLTTNLGTFFRQNENLLLVWMVSLSAFS